MGVAFELRPEAHFNDGTPVTAEDVAWTFNTLRDAGAAILSESIMPTSTTFRSRRPSRVVFHFKSAANRELPLILGEMAGAAETLVGRTRLRQAADRSAAGLRAVPGRPVSSSAAR